MPASPRTAGARRRARVTAAAVGVVLVPGLILGCASQDDQPTKAAPGDSPSLAPTTDAADPGDPGTPEVSSAPSPSATAAAPATLADRLLPTDTVPGLNDQWRWQDGETGTAGQDPFGACAKADLLSIGATEAVQRSYFPPDDSDDNAAEQVAEFPDAKTTATATAVLKSWHDKCAAKLGKKARIGRLTQVDGGSWYLVTIPSGGDDVRFRAFGYAVSGNRIAVLTIDNSGQDYNYSAGREPMALMVKAAAARLG